MNLHKNYIVDSPIIYNPELQLQFQLCSSSLAKIISMVPLDTKYFLRSYHPSMKEIMYWVIHDVLNHRILESDDGYVSAIYDEMIDLIFDGNDIIPEDKYPEIKYHVEEFTDRLGLIQSTMFNHLDRRIICESNCHIGNVRIHRLPSKSFCNYLIRITSEERCQIKS